VVTEDHGKEKKSLRTRQGEKKVIFILYNEKESVLAPTQNEKQIDACMLASEYVTLY